MQTTRTYRVRVEDAAGFLHTHDVTAPSAREARRIAFRATQEETGNAVFTYDVHTMRDGKLHAPVFLHPFAR